MIHKIEEGAELRWGFNIGKGYVGVRLHRRVMFWLDRRRGLSYFIDLTVDHRMYRPNDADAPYLHCRRCSQSSYEGAAHCSGKTYRRRNR